MFRFFLSFIVALFFTLVLFWSMQWLVIPKDGVEYKETRRSFVDFVRIKRDSKPPEEKKRIPPEPVDKQMPKMQTEVSSLDNIDAEIKMEVDIEFPSIKSSTGFFQGPKLSLPDIHRDSELIPLVRISPQYPMKARRLGIEGYVKLYVKVGIDGKTKSIEIIESEPKMIFDRAAKIALRRWKFKPKVVDGKAVEQSGHLRMVFKLQK